MTKAKLAKLSKKRQVIGVCSNGITRLLLNNTFVGYSDGGGISLTALDENLQNGLISINKIYTINQDTKLAEKLSFWFEDDKILNPKYSSCVWERPEVTTYKDLIGEHYNMMFWVFFKGGVSFQGAVSIEDNTLVINRQFSLSELVEEEARYSHDIESTYEEATPFVN
jgi:hypothetical protein